MLVRCLDAVYAQTLKPKQIIVVDDTPEDFVVPEEQEGDKEKFYEGEWPDTIPLLRLKSSGKGGATARNYGIKEVKTPFAAFCDDDDIWMPEKLKVQLQYLQRNPDCHIVGCSYVRDYGQFKRTILSKKQRFNEFDLLIENYLGSFSFCMVRMPENNKVRILDNLKACQDWYYWLSILRSNENSYGYILEEPLVVYNDIQIDTRLTRSYFNSYLSLSAFIKAISEKMNISDEVMSYHIGHLAIKLGLSKGQNLAAKFRLGIYAFRAYRRSGKIGILSSFYRCFIYQFNIRKLIRI